MGITTSNPMTTVDAMYHLRDTATALSETDRVAVMALCDALASARDELAAIDAVLDGKRVAMFAPPGSTATVPVFLKAQAEMAEHRMVIDHATKVYDHVTSGRISKLNTDPREVCSVADELEEVRQTYAINKATSGLRAACNRYVKDLDVARARWGALKGEVRSLAPSEACIRWASVLDEIEGKYY